MCMSGHRMTERRARIEIILIIVRAIRSVFFNLFMLGLGFVLGFGAYSHLHKIVDRRGHQKFQEFVSGTNKTGTVSSEKIAAPGEAKPEDGE